MKFLYAAAFLACILAANYVTTEYGLVWVFGLTATAGTYFAGATFVLRDAVQDSVRADLPDRYVLVEQFYEFGGRRISQGVRNELRPPRDRDVALRVVALIVIGAAISYLLAVTAFEANPAFLPPGVTPVSIALASGAAFLASETADLLVYTPLRRRGYVRAAVASNVVGAFVDTVLFLWIAGFPVWGNLAGQMVGKLAVTAVVIAGVVAVKAVTRWSSTRTLAETP